MSRKQIWLNPPLERLVEQCGQAKGRDGQFSRRLGDIVERYEAIIKNTSVPELTADEKMIIGEVVCGSTLTATTVKYMHESVLDCATGTANDRQVLADKIARWSAAERVAVIESLGI